MPDMLVMFRCVGLHVEGTLEERGVIEKAIGRSVVEIEGQETRENLVFEGKSGTLFKARRFFTSGSRKLHQLQDFIIGWYLKRWHFWLLLPHLYLVLLELQLSFKEEAIRELKAIRDVEDREVQNSMDNQRESHLQKTMLSRQVILFPFPFQGHLTPMLQLASILYSRGFSITIIHTNFNSPNSSNYPHFNFCSFQDGLSEFEASTTDVMSLISLLNAKYLVPFQDCLTKVVSRVDQEYSSTACLIVDSAWNFTKAVPEGLTLPFIILHPASVCSLLVYASWPLLLEKGYLPIKDSESEVLLPDLPPLRVKDIPLIKSDKPDSIDQLVSDFFSNQIKASSGFIYNSFQELEQDSLIKLRQDFHIPMFPIGPFHKYFPASSSSLLSEDQSSIPWLDKQALKSVIYVSFGSLAEVSEIEFLEIAWGLANANLPFLWVVRPGLVHGAEWMETLPKGFLEMITGRGHIVKWAPQQQVLAHPAIGGFWTHSGWNSTMESICEGVPMICQPFLGDQKVNARYVSDVWRVGLHLEGRLERGMIEEAIRRLMLETEGQKMRDRILYLKEKTELCLRQGGSSYQSLENLINYIMSL